MPPQTTQTVPEILRGGIRQNENEIPNKRDWKKELQEGSGQEFRSCRSSEVTEWGTLEPVMTSVYFPPRSKTRKDNQDVGV